MHVAYKYLLTLALPRSRVAVSSNLLLHPPPFQASHIGPSSLKDGVPLQGNYIRFGDRGS